MKHYFSCVTTVGGLLFHAADKYMPVQLTPLLQKAWQGFCLSRILQEFAPPVHAEIALSGRAAQYSVAQSPAFS